VVAEVVGGGGIEDEDERAWCGGLMVLEGQE
jgi:hypothetical protein